MGTTISIGDRVAVSFHASQVDLGTDLEALDAPWPSRDGVWVFRDHVRGCAHYVSEGCTVTKNAGSTADVNTTQAQFESAIRSLLERSMGCAAALGYLRQGQPSTVDPGRDGGTLTRLVPRPGDCEADDWVLLIPGTGPYPVLPKA